MNDTVAVPELVEGAAEVLAGEVSPTEVTKVVVIDDELFGLNSIHLQQTVHDFHSPIGETTSPQFGELWRLTEELGGLPDVENYDEEDQRKYLLSDNFVTSVVLHEQFSSKIEDPDVKAWLSPFLKHAEKVDRLRSALKEAFAGENFDLEFLSNRPAQPSQLLQYDLIVFDLVLQGSTAPVDELILYLKALGESQPNHLPSIIVMSSREELIQERSRFSTESDISAAGLMLLPKWEVFRENFGANGVKLSYQQLSRQRDVAQYMRVFMSAWSNALVEAQKRARVTLWNLDAAAMQEIHLSASLDSDPYDGHLSEFMAKEYLWHVEGAREVSDSIAKLDSCFKEQLKTGGKFPTIATRFMAPFVNPAVGRDLVSHFTWSGFSMDRDILSNDKEVILASFGQAMPFGTVLGPENVDENSEFLVHITQQCDILNVVRSREQGFTAKFAIAKPEEVSDNRIPVHKNDEIVARGLTLNGKEYDLKNVNGSILALTVDMLIDYLRTKRFNVVGRLRHEIAMQFLVATANHMTRPALIKTTRPQVHAVNVYLYGESLSGGELLPYTNTEGELLAVGMTKHNGMYYFSDESSMRIALWTKAKVDPCYSRELDLQKACDSLSIGVANKACVAGNVSLQFEDAMDERQRKDKFPSRDHKAKDKVMLVAICV
ncbi:hypothetical protein [Pseudomonas syringae]|uniref:hypothetical protein n=1 Tax=Pseudomonas syringae TaxID=317 RepID=UPI0002092069|nr:MULTISPECIES: hypothetical protein [Pseudomonas syringae group]EGH94871.1 hypothetical protein PLA106_02840 [Pseudomonas amygdali pv. lachrymans str. M302278]KPC11541.1 Uncharacterized protein AC500_1193 [Pseudomonas amygdali pv. lachrymans]RMM10878.1 hypothetical protein ALQ85_200147 [Pseudomonas syringae]